MFEGSQQSSDMEQTVRLMGDLGERYGFEHTYFNLRTPGEAIKLLCVNHPKLQEELVHAHEHGIGYQLVQADFALDYPDLQLPMGSNDLVLTPVVAGSGGGVGKILAGVAISCGFIFTARRRLVWHNKRIRRGCWYWYWYGTVGTAL
jgi:predicted phage tail protein